MFHVNEILHSCNHRVTRSDLSFSLGGWRDPGMGCLFAVAGAITARPSVESGGPGKEVLRSLRETVTWSASRSLKDREEDNSNQEDKEMKKHLLTSTACLALVLVTVFPVFATPAFKFAVIADPHMSVPGPNSPDSGTKMFKESVELLQSAIEDVNKAGDIDFVVALGDLTKDAEPWNVDRFKEVMDDLKMPYYVVLGNHDISPVDTHKSKRDPGVTRSTMIWTFQGHGYNGPSTHWGADPVPGVHLIGLDTTITGDWGGRVTNEGLRFLDKDLYANRGKFTILILHHQLLPYTKGEETGENDFDKFVIYNAKEVRDVLSKYPQVAMTLSGHRHISTRYKFENDIAYFTCPSTMTWPMRYIVFEVDDTGISYKTHNVPCSTQVWERAKQNALNTKVTQWPRTSETPNTPEGNQKLLSQLAGEEYKDGRIPLSSQLAEAVR
jgi:3',5'-cyclic AMP phosphodiesterase CpdA